MKFRIAIKDAFGNVLSEHDAIAEPQYICLLDSYEFEFEKFHMMISREVFDEIKWSDKPWMK